MPKGKGVEKNILEQKKDNLNILNYNIEPQKSVGPFIFNKLIQEYNNYNFDIDKCDGKSNWDTYLLKEFGIELHVENKRIVSIACFKECRLKGKNIIKMKIGDFVSNYNIFPDLNQTDTIFLGEEFYPHIVYEFESLGMQVWVKEGFINTVFCSPADEND